MSVHINPMQFAQNALEGPALDPILENFSLVPLSHPPADNTHGLDTPKSMDTPLMETIIHTSFKVLFSVMWSDCVGEREIFFIVGAMINKVHFVQFRCLDNGWWQATQL